MKKPSIGWQSWSPPFAKWHGLPHWDYNPFNSNDLLCTLHHSKSNQEKIRYWCSWYAYDVNITNQKIQTTLDIIKQHQLSFTHILIDDGWVTWGDWMTPNQTKFPDIRKTISSIHKNGQKAGLWFAPFLANKKSKLYHNHPDWFVKYRGKPVQGLKTISFWESFLPQQYLLDLELLQVRKYLTKFIDTAISNWQIDLLKLDFLYAPYFNPYYKSHNLPHSQVAWILSYIKTKYPNVITIASGAPFSPSVETASAIRISKDTALPPIIPTIFNKIFYNHRVKMLKHKLNSDDLPKTISLDPDVRMFSLDSIATAGIWDTIQTSVISVGDSLIDLSSLQLKRMKKWLTNHSSQ